jgi:hypothetical protein
MSPGVQTCYNQYNKKNEEAKKKVWGTLFVALSTPYESWITGQQ